jgi:signal transduction histidine kinase
MTGDAPPASPGRAVLLPASLLPPGEPGGPAGRGRRTLRDWLVDLGVFAGAALAGPVVLNATLTAAARPVPDGKQALDLLLGVLACLALWGRRRWPAPVAAVTVALTAFSSFAAVASLVAVFTVAVHRRAAGAGLAALGSVAAALIYAWWIPAAEPLLLTVTITAAALAIAVSWGLFVRARRELVWSLRDRAARAEAEQALRAEQARAAERSRIAREMHDVLAHRISLLALHAGGLEVSAGLPSAQVQQTGALLRTIARQALEELRDVIGVLREGPGGDREPLRPQPTLADLPRLVQERRAAGAAIDCEITTGGDAPDAVGRDAYRIVQEALTNVAKHADRAATRVRVAGAAGAGLTVSVASRLPAGVGGPALPGAGTGLIGLEERVMLAGGRLAHGPRDGEFVVEAVLPWP